MKRIHPKLVDGVRFIEEDGTSRIQIREYSCVLNKSAALIARCFDGTKSIEEVKRALAKQFPNVSMEHILACIDSLLFSLWVKGIFLEHDIDEWCCKRYLEKGDYVAMPSFCGVCDLPLSKMSPAILASHFPSPSAFSDVFRDTILYAGKITDSGQITGIAILAKTAIPSAFFVYALYGDITLDDLVNPDLKDCIMRVTGLNREGSSRMIHYLMYRTEKDLDQGIHRLEACQTKLQGEHPSGMLFITRLSA